MWFFPHRSHLQEELRCDHWQDFCVRRWWQGYPRVLVDSHAELRQCRRAHPGILSVPILFLYSLLWRQYWNVDTKFNAYLPASNVFLVTITAQYYTPLHYLRNLLALLFQEHDVEVLKHLVDISSETHFTGDFPSGFTMKFTFSKNPFFSNKVRRVPVASIKVPEHI